MELGLRILRWKWGQAAKLVLIVIPVALALALVVLFFSNVLFGADWKLLSIWKWAYIVLFVCIFLKDVVIAPIMLYRLCLRLSEQYKTSTDRVATALIEYRMAAPSNKNRWLEWGPKEFNLWMAPFEMPSHTREIIQTTWRELGGF